MNHASVWLYAAQGHPPKRRRLTMDVQEQPPSLLTSTTEKKMIAMFSTDS